MEPWAGSGALFLCSAPSSFHFPMGPMSLPCWVFGTPHVRDAQEMPEGFDMNAGGMSSGGEWGGKEKSLPLILQMGTEARRVEVTSPRFHS